MNYKLLRQSNQNSWLKGTITESNKFICDSMEFGSLNRLKAGLYKLKITTRSNFNPYGSDLNNEENCKTIQLFDDFKNVCSQINNKTDMVFHNIRMRVNNSNIVCCLVTSDYRLRTPDAVNFLLIQAIEKDESLGIESTIEVIEPSYLDSTFKSIEYITEY